MGQINRRAADSRTIRQSIRDAHKRAARILGLALMADGPDVWGDVAALWTLHLQRHERVALAFAALRALSPEDRAAVVAAAGGAG